MRYCVIVSEDNQSNANEKQSVWITRREDQEEEEDTARQRRAAAGQKRKKKQDAARQCVEGARLVLLLVGAHGCWEGLGDIVIPFPSLGTHEECHEW